MADEAPDPEKTLAQKVIQADTVPPAQQAWYTSPQALAAVSALAGGFVGVNHFLCIGFGICLLDKINLQTWTFGLGGLLSIVGGGFALYRRIKAGLDPATDATKLTLFK